MENIIITYITATPVEDFSPVHFRDLLFLAINLIVSTVTKTARNAEAPQNTASPMKRSRDKFSFLSTSPDSEEIVNINILKNMPLNSSTKDNPCTCTCISWLHWYRTVPSTVTFCTAKVSFPDPLCTRYARWADLLSLILFPESKIATLERKDGYMW